MRFTRIMGRRAVVRAAVGLVVAGTLTIGAGAPIEVGHGATVAAAAPARVLMYDNGGIFAPGDVDTGMWTYTPNHIDVVKGEPIEFVNPAGNARPHTVTSISASGPVPTRTLASGMLFDSSPTREDFISPGSTWTLDTSTLDAGQYTYYCTIHPWMVGTFTLTPAP